MKLFSNNKTSSKTNSLSNEIYELVKEIRTFQAEYETKSPLYSRNFHKEGSVFNLKQLQALNLLGLCHVDSQDKEHAEKNGLLKSFSKGINDFETTSEVLQLLKDLAVTLEETEPLLNKAREEELTKAAKKWKEEIEEVHDSLSSWNALSLTPDTFVKTQRDIESLRQRTVNLTRSINELPSQFRVDVESFDWNSFEKTILNVQRSEAFQKDAQRWFVSELYKDLRYWHIDVEEIIDLSLKNLILVKGVPRNYKKEVQLLNVSSEHKLYVVPAMVLPFLDFTLENATSLEGVSSSDLEILLVLYVENKAPNLSKAKEMALALSS